MLRTRLPTIIIQGHSNLQHGFYSSLARYVHSMINSSELSSTDLAFTSTGIWSPKKTVWNFTL